jgi:hypothetical protein
MLKYKYEDSLTNERLTKQCRNQFDLVGRAIKVAEYLVKSGKATTDWPDNVSYEVLRRMSDEGVDVAESEILQEG